MITKIKYIKNLAVFKDFEWDKEVKNEKGEILEFKKTNIIYGRNYSGKTTLSRIFRAMETGKLSSKYDNPECCIKFNDVSDVIQDDFTTHKKQVRVFNEDFIRDNLRFVVNPDDSIEPFAIVGGDNNTIENEINVLKDKLGENEKEKETRLYKDLLNGSQIAKQAAIAVEAAKKKLTDQLSLKAIGNPHGIKYKPEIYGDQLYSNPKLLKEISVVKNDSYEPISDDKKSLLLKLLNEQKKDSILDSKRLNILFEDLNEQTSLLLSRKITQSNKIDGLLKDAMLWVKEGIDLHKNKRSKCSFCDNDITKERWIELENHFNEESSKLEDNLKILISNIKNEIEKLEDFKMEVKDKYYSKFHVEYEIINAELIDCLKSSKDALELLINQLENRLNDVFNPLAFKEPPFDKQKLIEIFKKIEQLNIRSNDYTKNLVKEQNEAKKELRLREIFDFINTIQYDNQTSEIASLEAVFEMEKNKKATIKKEIDDILVLITQKQNQLNDEGGAVDKVNEFLNSHFGHQFLTLVAIEFDDDVTGNKKYRFEVQRDGKKAHHLSEGEVSLIAFCYFIAKLKDIKTKGKKPIIWIDDPISSLDSNHIFFIYTLINTQIYGDEEFEQLFISTHNLNFLKYLKRLPGADITKETKTRFRHLIINRSDKNSIIKSMPNFLKNYVTEFNYLFEQIYKCSIMSNVNDSNYTEYYNFGNNARKFLELFLFYKYPDTTTQTQKIKKFFGENNIPSIFTDRINNEYSHLSGCFERGETLIEEPEMYTAAKLIIDRIKYHDIDQYQALVNSVEISFEQA